VAGKSGGSAGVVMKIAAAEGDETENQKGEHQIQKKIYRWISEKQGRGDRSERGEKIARKTRKINREIEERSRIGIVREKEGRGDTAYAQTTKRSLQPLYISGCQLSLLV
jgi:hypothetical protein